MNNENYAIACTEILEILKYIPESDYKKIPLNVIVALEKNKNPNIVYLYNPWKSLTEQEISENGKEMLAVFYKKYWATDEEKKKINAFQNKKTQELYSNNSYNDIFKNINNDVKETTENKDLVVYKDGKFKKLINFIKSFLKLK